MKSATFPKRVAMAATLCASLLFPSLSQAQNEPLERSFCVFDPVGANGPLFANDVQSPQIEKMARNMLDELGFERID